MQPDDGNNQSASSRASDDDAFALATAAALCLFLWGLKTYLAAWLIAVKGVHPLADASRDAPVFVGGADLIFCAGLAVIYRLTRAVSRWRCLPRIIALPLRHAAPFLIHAAVVVFSVASILVARVYGDPLEIYHLRSADDPRIIKASLLAYVGALPVALVVIGLLTYPLIGLPLVRFTRPMIGGRSRWRVWGTTLGFCGVMFALWTVRLRGVDTFGVKANAVLHFAEHYRPPLKPIDARRERLALAQELDALDSRQALRPIHVEARAELTRDFDVDGGASPDAARDFNVLVIQMESTSARYCDDVTTPNLMRLASQGVSFVNHTTVYTETITASYALYYSDYLADLGTTPRMLYGRPMPQPNLADVLHARGYATALFESSFLSWGDFRFFFEHKGFDTIVDAGDLWDTKEPLPWSWGVREEQTVAALTEWIGRQRDAGKPFFAIYATMFPHHPYDCPLPPNERPFAETSWLNRYRNSLYYADRNVGTVIGYLRDHALLDDTLVVIVGDHGETVMSYPVGHGIALTLEEIRPPLILSNPRLFPSPRRSALPSNHLDVAPTILGLLEIAAPAEWLGRDLSALSIPPMLSHVTVHLSHFTGIIDNGLLATFNQSGSRRQLYDISAGAMTPIAASDECRKLLDEYHERDELLKKWIVYRHLKRATATTERENRR